MTSRFEDALVLAAQLHREQRRKGSNVPYVSHLLAVSSLVIEHGGDEDQAIAALLHDAIEDQGGPRARAEILRRFGERVTGIVEGCTDSQTIPKPPWKERKLAYIAGISEKSPSVLLVCAADKLHNARSILRLATPPRPPHRPSFRGKSRDTGMSEWDTGEQQDTGGQWDSGERPDSRVYRTDRRRMLAVTRPLARRRSPAIGTRRGGIAATTRAVRARPRSPTGRGQRPGRGACAAAGSGSRARPRSV